MEGADLSAAHLEGADLSAAHLEGADLSAAHLEGKSYSTGDPDLLRIRHIIKDFPSILNATDLHLAYFDTSTIFNDAVLGNEIGSFQVADIHWGDVNLAVVPWETVRMLGDEQIARQRADDKQKKKTRDRRRYEFAGAVRANRQLAVFLRAQGMNEVADRFAYRAQLCQRTLIRLRGIRGFGGYLGSGFLDLLAGYGFRPERSFFAYIAIISLFATLYHLLGVGETALNWQESFVVSMTAFHGRGFFATAFQPGDPQAIAAAFEAFIGLIIEVSFIATFTQRFFSR